MSQKKKPIHEKVLKMWNSCNKNEDLMKEELHKSGMSYADFIYVKGYFEHTSPKNEDSDNIIEILNEFIAGAQIGTATVFCKINE